MTTTKVKFLKGLAKIAGAGATIFAVGFGVITFGDSEGTPAVQEAKADIWSLSFTGNDNQKKFVDALMAEGMEEPRAYNWNDNVVFFSTTTTAESPVQVMRRFQDQFVEQGLNSEPHYTTLPPISEVGVDFWEAGKDQQRRGANLMAKHVKSKDDMFSGGVVPTIVTDNMVQMIGVEPKGDTKGSMEFVLAMADTMKEGKTVADTIQGIRYLDAVRTNSGLTRITATWSDENFDFDRIKAPEKRAEEIVPAARTIEVPKCLGCSRMMYFEGLSVGEKGYVNEIFRSPKPALETLTFYDQALRKRGWQLTDSSRTMIAAKKGGLMEEAGGKLAHYARGNDFITVLAYPEEAGSTVQLFESP